MRILIPLFALLGACKPPPPDLSSITKELAALREGLEEVKKVSQPKLDAVEAMDDLAREVKQLRQKVATAPTAPVPAPVAPALAVGGPPIKTGELTGGVGGSQAGVNDLYWVLSRVLVNGEERTVLCLYRALPGKEGIQLSDVRMLNMDVQLIEYNQNRPRVKEIMEVVERQKQRK